MKKSRRLAQRLTRFVPRWHNALAAASFVLVVLAAFRLWPHEPLSAALPSSTALYDDQGKLLRLTLSADDKYRLWVPLADMPAALVDGVLLHEDAWFRWHPGFNPVSLARGAFVTYVQGGNRQGGSTI
ncbi:MAG TPA: transglycosylase domain-containing protein, partial [Tahibacter sp.]|nr:transglycosylase domain-containing protein [Tahibacter sp.]